MIVKLQRPFASLETVSPWLAYDKSRRHYMFICTSDIPADVLAALGNDRKGYFEATVSDADICFGARVADQPW